MFSGRTILWEVYILSGNEFKMNKKWLIFTERAFVISKIFISFEILLTFFMFVPNWFLQRKECKRTYRIAIFKLFTQCFMHANKYLLCLLKWSISLVTYNLKRSIDMAYVRFIKHNWKTFLIKEQAHSNQP